MPGTSKKTGYNKNWYKEWFGEDYLTVYKHRNDMDAKKMIELVNSKIPLNKDMTVLDLACGNGRHSYRIAPRCKQVFGLDLSSHLLSEAQKKKKAGKPPVFVQADMMHFPFKSRFDLIISLFTSFGYFDSDFEHQQVADQIAAALKPGAWFVIDYFNAAFVSQNLVPQGERIVEDMHISEKRWIANGRVYKDIVLNHKGIKKQFHESVRIFELKALTDLLMRSGLQLKALFGDYAGNAYTNDAQRMILFCQKK